MDFETYWREHYRYYPDVEYKGQNYYISHDLAKKVWNDAEHFLNLEAKKQFDKGYREGYSDGESCKD